MLCGWPVPTTTKLWLWKRPGDGIRPKNLTLGRTFFIPRAVAIRAPSAFRQRDLTRAIRALAAAGHVGVVRVDPRTGKIEVEIGKAPEPTGPAADPWDKATNDELKR
jgi:hypothetical protein